MGKQSSAVSNNRPLHMQKLNNSQKSQKKSKQEEHNCINALAKPIEPIELTNFCLKIKEDHLQTGVKRNLEAWQDREGTIEGLLTTIRQNRSLFPRQQTAEQQRHRAVCQPTLRAMKSLAWCMYERGNSENGIFIHEIRSHDSKITRRVLTEPTRTAARSCVRQLLDND